MAKKNQPRFSNTGNIESRNFDKDLVEDVKDYHLGTGSWTQARNAVNNSHTGDVGDLGSEPSNRLCTQAPYDIIGGIHLEADRWVIFATNDIDSEIGFFTEGSCSYKRIVNDQCLNFDTSALVTGVSKELYDCSWQVYWDDGRNPSRTMNVDNVPWIQNCVTVDGCVTCTNTTDLDCDKILLSPLMSQPCVELNEGASGGNLLNGSYYIVTGYLINGQRIGDYSVPSNIQSIFHHQNSSGSLDIEILDMDENFDEFELVLVSIVNQQTVARRVGAYSTRQKRITIDLIDERWPSVPLEFIPIRNPVIERSDAMYEVNDYMLRVGPTTKLDFNYQPLANQIGVKWACVEYPADYYRKGNNNVGYMRDENYALFIRFVYDTGDKSVSFHIPGRGANATDFDILAGPDAEPEISEGITPYRWIVQNTATITSLTASTLSDGGVQIAEGDMGYYESTEFYDDDKPEIWNANIPGHPEWDLCGKPIRHHKFPDNITAGSNVTNHYSPGGENIRIMGIKLSNIQPPVDNNGNVITSIVGYEILRGTREGNKTVIAKGMINNMFEYDIEGGITNRQGLYPNYPYNDLRPDPFLSQNDVSYEPLNANGPWVGYNPIEDYSQNHFTFHSPDTQFRDPHLSMNEVKIYGQVRGEVDGQFVFPDRHPKHKFVTDQSFYIAVLAGIGLAMIAVNGERRTHTATPGTINLGGSGLWAGASTGTFAQPGIAGIPDLNATGIAAVSAYYGAASGIDAGFYTAGGALLGNIIGLSNNGYYTSLETSALAVTAAPGTVGFTKTYEQEAGIFREAPLPIRLLQGAPTFTFYLTEGVDSILRLIRAFSPYRQFALQYQSHCLYTEFDNPQVNNHRRSLQRINYLDNQIQDFGANHRINNLFRSRSVVFESTLISDAIGDNSRQSVGDQNPLLTGPDFENPNIPFNTQAASHYTALKQRIRNQYGQIESIIQVPVTTCMIDISQVTTPVLFGGDIYIGRYTEKNTMFFSFDWLYDQPDGAEFNYHTRKMIPHPKFWMDTDPFDFNEFVGSLGAAFANLPNFFSTLVTPSDKHSFDRNPAGGGFFTVRNAYMYLFNSGVRDFFVESEINIEQRDWGDDDSERHYDWNRYTDLKAIFNSGIIKSGNYYKYDYSLSVSRLFNNFIAWGNVHQRTYDPTVAEQCYKYRPDRVLYSLAQQDENIKDFWRVFLPNNYKDFKSRITAIKTINKTGALFLFENESPIQFVGVDQLQTSAGTKITIGDGGLFNQPLQNLLNSDRPYEYGSCQNRLSVINTPAGLFWMSQNQGKIFQYSGAGLKEISLIDLKWWFASFLPYKLLDDFPDFELIDNPVAGIGCQAIYDNENGLVYFCKKDYVIKPEMKEVVTYDREDNFLVLRTARIKLGDPVYFDDASWTVSYDPKSNGGQGGWLSYHDWHPDLLLPGKNTFMSILNKGIWIHNERCDSYCNFYGIDYPFEVEYMVDTVQLVNTLRSAEYQMEVYIYDDNCFDRYHALDFNFDEAVVYNSEQCSGLLRLNLHPKNDFFQSSQYPIVNATSIDILYSKEEQRYRFNQFWDITDDRGEFSTAERMIWNTEPNGYIRNLNPINLNYSKAEFERKKFRHYQNVVLLRRRVCGNKKMIVRLTNNKNLISPR